MCNIVNLFIGIDTNNPFFRSEISTISQESIVDTARRLLQQAGRNDLPPVQQERAILQDFGRSLSSIIAKMDRVSASYDMWIYHPPQWHYHWAFLIFFQVQLQYREAPQLQYGGGVVDFANRTLNATVSKDIPRPNQRWHFRDSTGWGRCRCSVKLPKYFINRLHPLCIPTTTTQPLPLFLVTCVLIMFAQRKPVLNECEDIIS